MMRYRGTDDNQVRYGHFSESRILQSGPEDRVIPYKGERLKYNENAYCICDHNGNLNCDHDLF